MKKITQVLKPGNLVPNVLNLLINPNQSHREDVFTIKIKNHTVDTVYANDTNLWETGIERNAGEWIIVQQYKDKNEANIGHKKWVKKIKNNPKCKLEDINLYNL